MINLLIDGRNLVADEGETLLSVARRNGIAVPSLCHHPAVEGSGACRLCMVEISKRGPGAAKTLVTSCLYPAEDGLVVETKSPAVLESRRATLDLLLARCPDTPAISKLAAEHGVYETSFMKREKDDHCILCGICTRICDMLGHSAISTVNRGSAKLVGPPFGDAPDRCVGCGACHRSCPTGAIRMEEKGGVRRIWGRDFELMSCESCGRAHVTRAQADFLCAGGNFTLEYFKKCDACRRAEVSAAMAGIVKWQGGEAQ